MNNFKVAKKLLRLEQLTTKFSAILNIPSFEFLNSSWINDVFLKLISRAVKKSLLLTVFILFTLYCILKGKYNKTYSKNELNLNQTAIAEISFMRKPCSTKKQLIIILTLGSERSGAVFFKQWSRAVIAQKVGAEIQHNFDFIAIFKFSFGKMCSKNKFTNISIIRKNLIQPILFKLKSTRTSVVLTCNDLSHQIFNCKKIALKSLIDSYCILTCFMHAIIDPVFCIENLPALLQLKYNSNTAQA